MTDIQPMEPTRLASPAELAQLAQAGITIPAPRRETYLPPPVRASQWRGLLPGAARITRRGRRWPR